MEAPLARARLAGFSLTFRQTSGRPARADHGAHGAGHVCFRIAPDALSHWRERLEFAGVAIESEIDWPRGGSSLYVRDPAGNSVELAPALIWGVPA